MRSRLVLLTVMSAGLMAAACGGPAAPAPPATTAPPVAAQSRVALAVPPGEGGGAFATPRTVTVPAGWTARVWARVPDARMEAWAPEGDLLVSQPNLGSIVELKPGAHGTGQRVVERGVRNGEGLAVAPDGSVWTAVNNRDNVPYPFHSPYAGYRDAFGQVIQAYVNEHPADEVARVTAGRDLGWPYCNPDQDRNHPAGSLADVPFVPDSVSNPGGSRLDCATLPPVEVGLPAHSAPLGMSFLPGSAIPAPWSGGAVVAAHGSWDRQPPRPPAVLWLAWDAARHTLKPALTLVGGFQNAAGDRWGRPADAVAGPDRALYVSDDTAGAVYRLAPPG